jgi:hypothetical protein
LGAFQFPALLVWILVCFSFNFHHPTQRREREVGKNGRLFVGLLISHPSHHTTESAWWCHIKLATVAGVPAYSLVSLENVGEKQLYCFWHRNKSPKWWWWRRRRPRETTVY